MNEQIHIEKSLLTCIYFRNQFPLTFLVFKNTSKIPHTHKCANTHTRTNKHKNTQNLSQWLEEWSRVVDLYTCAF